MSRRSKRAYDMQTALDGIRQTAAGKPGARFPTLMHHIYQVDRLRAAYMACKRHAAAGVDGQTWQGYGKERDQVQIVKDDTAPPKRLANPRKPEPADGPARLKSYVPAADVSGN